MQAERSEHFWARRGPAQTLRLAALGALVAIAVAACGGSSGGSTSGGTGPTNAATASKQPLQSMFWADPQLYSNPVRTMRTLKALGVHVVRTSILWANVVSNYSFFGTKPVQLHPTDPATYLGWAPWDAIDRAAAQTGMRLYLTITGPIPLWAAGPNPPKPLSVATGVVWKPSATQFGKFVQAAGKRYSGHYTPPGAKSPLPRVSFWSIWNEPNYGTDIQPQTQGGHPVSAGIYRRLLNAGWNGLHLTGHTTATDTILIGETAPYGVEPSSVRANHEMAPLAFLRGLYCVNADYRPLRGPAAAKIGCPASSDGFQASNPALFDASGWADHPYTGGQAPTVVSRGIPGSADYADFGALGRLGRALDRSVAAYGSHVKLPLYNTEFGYRTNPPFAGPTTVSPARAARYINQAEYLSWHNHRIRSYNQYELVDTPGTPGSNFATGLKFNTGGKDVFAGRRKPAFYSYRMPLWIPRTHATGRRRLTVWGCARAAPVVARQSGKPQQVLIQLAGRGGGFRTLQTVTLRNTASRGCYFQTAVRFPHSGNVRLAWSNQGNVQFSRLQRITVS